MSEIDKLSEVRPRWGALQGNMFNSDESLWGCGAYLLSRAAVANQELLRAPPNQEQWWPPSGVWEHLGERTTSYWLDGYETLTLHPRGRLTIAGVWDTSPGSRPSGRVGLAHQYRVLVRGPDFVGDTWFSGIILRCLWEMARWDYLCRDAREDRTMALLVRGATLVEPPQIVGVVSPMRSFKGQPFPEWNQLWPQAGVEVEAKI